MSSKSASGKFASNSSLANLHYLQTHIVVVMNRNLAGLTNQKFDLLVIGGGITGTNIAWDATLRGLRVALVEKGDFGNATSANSLKTVHGGLRYLQDGNLRLVRKMVRERQALLRIAPHLVHPLPVVMPTMRGKLMRSKPVLATAVKLNDLASFDRNVGMDEARALPNGRILSRKQLVEMIPDLGDQPQLSGGVMWHDAQLHNSERLLLSFLLSAVKGGAQISNYVRVTGFLQEERRVTGVTAVDELGNTRDELTGSPFQIQARMVVNAAGPWIDELLETVDAEITLPKFRLSTAMNLVTRQILPKHALGISSHYWQPMPDGSAEERSRVLFVAPWRSYSLVGTLHAPFNGRSDDKWLTENMITGFVDEINRAFPAAGLRREDVYQAHRGFLPMLPPDADLTTVKLVREGQVIDHLAESDLSGLITAMGVKYTTARYLAQKTVDAVFAQLKRPSPTCQTRTQQLVGGQILHFDTFEMAAMERWPIEMPPYQLRRLIRNYGTTHRQLLPYLLENEAWKQPMGEETAVTGMEIIHAVRAEMVQKLSDVVLRRTEMGSAEQPSDGTLLATARLMATELGWDSKRIDREIEAVKNRSQISS